MSRIGALPLSISSPIKPSDDDKARIALQYQDAIRVLQGQVAGGDALDRKTEHLVYVGLIGLAAAFTIASFAIGAASVSSWTARSTFGAILFGAVVNIAALVVASQAYAGIGAAKPTRADSPSLRELSDSMRKLDVPEWKYQVSIIHGLADAWDANDEEAARNVHLRTLSLRLLIGATAAYALAAAISTGAAAFAK